MSRSGESSTSRVAAIEQTIAARMPGIAWGPFPSADIKKICPIHAADMYTAFDLYFADIAGYTSNVRTIRRRRRSDLLDLKRRLSRSFFERYQEFEPYREMITPEATPDLHRHLSVVELNRADLVRLIDAVIEVCDSGDPGRRDVAGEH